MKIRNLLIATISASLLAIATASYAAADKTAKPGNVMAHGQAKSNQFWWPDQLDLTALRDHDSRSNPMGDDFNYAEAFGKLDSEVLSKYLELVYGISNSEKFISQCEAKGIIKFSKHRNKLNFIDGTDIDIDQSLADASKNVPVANRGPP